MANAIETLRTTLYGQNTIAMTGVPEGATVIYPDTGTPTTDAWRSDVEDALTKLENLIKVFEEVEQAITNYVRPDVWIEGHPLHSKPLGKFDPWPTTSETLRDTLPKLRAAIRAVRGEEAAYICDCLNPCPSYPHCPRGRKETMKLRGMS